MAKQKKTREQKIIAKLRHKLTSKGTLPQATSISVAQKAPAFSYAGTNSAQPNKLVNYSYVAHDLTKTGFITIGIICLELIFFLLVKNHIILASLNY